MAGLTIDYSKITLQENIQFSQAELAQFEKRLVDENKLPRYVGLVVLPVLALLYWIVKDDLGVLADKDYLAGALITLIAYFFVYGIGKLLVIYDRKRIQKDMQSGKCKLQSVLMQKEKNKYGTFLSFAGTHEKQKIRIEASLADYKRLAVGAKVCVFFLQHRKEAISIEEAHEVYQ
jgi:hypothetical protein